jgi:hypothetical protein
MLIYGTDYFLVKFALHHIFTFIPYHRICYHLALKIYTTFAIDLFNNMSRHVCECKALTPPFNKYFRVPEVQGVLSRSVKRLGCVCQSFRAVGEGGDESQKCNRNEPINGVVLVCITQYMCITYMEIITLYRIRIKFLFMGQNIQA